MLDNRVQAIYEDRSGVMWLGHYRSGLSRYVRRQDQFFRLKIADGVYAICEDRHGQLWIGADSTGLRQYDRDGQLVAHYRHDPRNPESLSNDQVLAIYEDRRGDLWLGTFGSGLCRFDKNTQQLTGYQPDAKNPESLRRAAIYSLYLDQGEYLWIGTFGGGLIRFDPRTERFTHYNDRDGLADNFVKGILPDAHGNLWLSTDKGLSRFDPRTITFRNFTVKEGLVTNVLLSGAYHKSRDGRMFFGGEGGVVAFHPDSIRDNPRIPPVVITSFKVFDRKYLLAG